MESLLGSRFYEHELTDAIDQGTSYDLPGDADEDGQRDMEWERDWFTALLKANHFIKKLARSKKAFSVETAAIARSRNSELFILNGDPRLIALHEHWHTLQEWVNTPSLKERLSPNVYMEAFLETFTVCDELNGLVKKSCKAVGETLCPMERTTATKIITALNEAHDSLRQLTSSPAFRKQANNAQRASNKRRRGMVDLVDSLFIKHSRLVVVRVDLGYQRKHGDIDFDTVWEHRNTLLGKRRSDLLFEHLIDYCWKLEYGPRKRYHYHMLFFFDGAKVREDMTLAQQIGRHWVKNVTSGKGTYYNCNAGAQKRYKFNAMGMLRHDDAEKMKGLRHVVNYLTKIDDLMTLHVPGKHHTFGRGTLPRQPRSSRGRPRLRASTLLSSLDSNHITN
jgi:hypothetical protein